MRWRCSAPLSDCFWCVSVPSKPMMNGELFFDDTDEDEKKPSLDRAFAVAIGQSGKKKCCEHARGTSFVSSLGTPDSDINTHTNARTHARTHRPLERQQHLFERMANQSQR